MKQMTASELKKKLDNKEPVIVIDVREPWEFEEQSICSQNIPLYSLPEKMDQLMDLKDKPFVVHCKTGSRGTQAQKFLQKNGFKEVINLQGGIEAYLKL